MVRLGRVGMIRHLTWRRLRSYQRMVGVTGLAAGWPGSRTAPRPRPSVPSMWQQVRPGGPMLVAGDTREIARRLHRAPVVVPRSRQRGHQRRRSS